MLKQLDIDKMVLIAQAEVAERLREFYERFIEVPKPVTPPPKPEKVNYG